MKNLFWLGTILILFAISCTNENAKNEIRKTDITLELKRFDRDFAQASPSDLPLLKKEYPYLFPIQFHDSIWIAKMTDTLQIEIQNEVFKAFPDFDKEYEGLKLFYQHLHYYFPSIKIPTVITLAEEVDYRNKVILNDELLLISLDNYLGKNHRFYEGLFSYVADLQDKDYLLSDIAEKYALKLNHQKQSRNFLATMIYYGKIRYVISQLIPFQETYLHLHYSKEELDWAKRNEFQIWQYFIDKELLYDTDYKLNERFINMAPYSKFYLELDSESPPRLGQFIGYRIVEDFMKNNPSVDLSELLKLEEDNLFKQSAYKPIKE